MRIAIIGAGAIGGYFGGRLAAAGTEVAFVARGRTLEVLRQTGLRLSSPLGDLHLPSVEASDDPAALAPADAVLVAVKSWQVAGVAETIGPLLRPVSCVLPLQNGVDAPAQLAAVLGPDRVLGGLCKIICHIETPGHIRHIGADPLIALGELDDGASARVDRLHGALTAAGIKANVPDSIQAAMWEKFLFICAVSGLGAVTRMPLGVLREDPHTRDLLQRLMQEILQVAEARSIPLKADIVERSLSFIDSLPPSVTASMQRDIMEGRPSELEAQNGAVVRLGREVDVPTPTNELIYHLLAPLERQARGE
ncbi:MAG: 2-dehydropantoate 2-reductase [Acidobacteriota bacterium]